MPISSRRGNAACNTDIPLGSRSLPNFKNHDKRHCISTSSIPAPLKKKQKDTCLKLFNVSDIDESGSLRVLYEVPIDLQNLRNLHGDFTIWHVQKEITVQCKSQKNFVILNKKGNPIRDFPTTRGMYNLLVFSKDYFHSFSYYLL